MTVIHIPKTMIHRRPKVKNWIASIFLKSKLQKFFNRQPLLKRSLKSKSTIAILKNWSRIFHRTPLKGSKLGSKTWELWRNTLYKVNYSFNIFNFPRPIHKRWTSILLVFCRLSTWRSRNFQFLIISITFDRKTEFYVI